MKFIKRFLWFIIVFTILLCGCYILFFLIFVIPNDQRVKKTEVSSLTPIAERRVITYNLIDMSSQATITHEDFERSYAEFRHYPFVNNNPDFHLIPENMHVSLGWYPLKVLHKNCLYAPVPTKITYRLKIPKEKPQLLFAGGVLDRQADFQVRVKTPYGDEKIIFQTKVLPLARYHYRYTDKFYRHFLQYLNVQLEERDYRWQDFVVDLSGWAGQTVEIQLVTVGNQAQAFWGNPLITAGDKDPDFKYNLLLIITDAVGKEAIGRQDDGRSFTPYLDKLSAQGISFENHLANGNMTKQSVTSFLSSRWPFELGDVSLEYVSSGESKKQFYHHKFPTLASALNQNGYLTGAIGVISLFTDGAGFGVDFGFNDAIIMERFGYNNAHITQEAIEWLEHNGNLPFALMVYYDSAHGPYKPPLRYLWKTRSQFTDFNAQSWYKTLYEATIAYNDAYIGNLLASLERLGLWENTLVVVTSDHAENLAWHTLPGGKGKSIFHDHGISLKKEDIHVPLIFRFPAKFTTSRKIEEITEHLDLAPTILDLLNLPVPPDFQGISLEPSFAGVPPRLKPVIFLRGRFNKGILLNQRYKYIRNFGVYEKKGKLLQDFIPEELYDLQQDPLEEKNIIDRGHDIRYLVRTTLDAYEPDPERNFFTFCNMGEDKAEVSITAQGVFSQISLEGGGYTHLSGNVLRASLIGKKAVLAFDTTPYNAPLSIKIYYPKGEYYPLAKVFVSANVLRLLSDDKKEIGGNDLYLCGGNVEIQNNISPDFAVYWARVAQFKTEWEKQRGVGGIFKQMLAEWGYLSEPEKK